MKVTSIAKHKTHYEVIINDETLMLNPSMLLKYRLKVGDDISTQQFQQMIQDKHYDDFDQMALKKLKKMHTTYELQTFLESKGAPKAISKQLIDRYIKYKYLDDLNYAKTFCLLKASTYGPNMMIEKLRAKGISEGILKHVFEGYNEANILKHLMQKKVAKTKNKSKNQLKTQLYTHFITKGFSPDVIQAHLSKALEDYDVDEDALIEKTYRLAYHKYRQSYAPHEASQKTLQKCLQKGFKYDDIKRMIAIIEEENA